MQRFSRSHWTTVACIGILFILPFLLFFPVTFGPLTLLPLDNLYQWSPFGLYPGAKKLLPPQNYLLSDLVLQNYVWKRFIVSSLRSGEFPLWNPYTFAGVPFFAAGQHSALYPLSILYYVLPLEKAYGWFTVLHVGLAGVSTFCLMRTFRVGYTAAVFAGVAYQFSGLLITATVFPMITASVVWLPLLLAFCELLIQPPEPDARPRSAAWVVVGGALAISFLLLAGHVEMAIHAALTTGLFCIWRLIDLWRCRLLNVAAVAGRLGRLFAMGLLGVGLGAIQIVPMFELVRTNFRVGALSFDQVIHLGLTQAHAILWLVPDFYGNPSQHSYFDLFSWTTKPIGTPNGSSAWGDPNYVEVGVYVGVITLVCVVLAVLWWTSALVYQRIRRRGMMPAHNLYTGQRTPTGFFIVLALLSLAFIFGTRLYAVLYYGVPGVEQLRSPPRWKFPLTCCLAVLAGVGIQQLIQLCTARARRQPDSIAIASLDAKTGRAILFGAALLCLLLGGIALGGLAVIRLNWTQYAPFIAHLLGQSPVAMAVFPDLTTFFSYEGGAIARAAVVLILSGGLLVLGWVGAGARWWRALMLILLVGDLCQSWAGFNPATDPQLISDTPDVVRFLQTDTSMWRMTTYDPHGYALLNANIPWMFGLQDVRGYDSIIPRQYTDYMALIEPQHGLVFNRIVPLRFTESLASPLLDLLNVKYIVSHETIERPDFKLVYDGPVRVYQNLRVLPRAFVLPATSTVIAPDFAAAAGQYDPRRHVIVREVSDQQRAAIGRPQAADPLPASITRYTNNEVALTVTVHEPSWLVLGDSYFRGWKVFIRSSEASFSDEQETEPVLANGNFRAVWLPGPLASAPAVTYHVRFVYAPDSVQLGGWISLGAALGLLALSGYALFGRPSLPPK